MKCWKHLGCADRQAVTEQCNIWIYSWYHRKTGNAKDAWHVKQPTHWEHTKFNRGSQEPRLPVRFVYLDVDFQCRSYTWWSQLGQCSKSLYAARKLNNNSLSGVLPDSLANIDGLALVYALQSFLFFLCLMTQCSRWIINWHEFVCFIVTFLLTIWVVHCPRFLLELSSM
jgi:hypothetical protein